MELGQDVFTQERTAESKGVNLQHVFKITKVENVTSHLLNTYCVRRGSY